MYLHLISVLDTAHFDIVSGCVWDDGKDDPALEFCRSLNAEPWQTLEYMEYSGSPFPEEIEMVPYSDEYYETLAAKKCEAWRKLAAVYGLRYFHTATGTGGSGRRMRKTPLCICTTEYPPPWAPAARTVICTACLSAPSARDRAWAGR